MDDDGMLEAFDLAGATLAEHHAEFGYRIYALAQPLAPGEERDITFRVALGPDGISGDAPDTRIVENGTFFNNGMFPTFGYQSRAEIEDRNERRKRGLGEPRRMPRLEDTAARSRNYVTADADWIDFRTTACTAPDQIILAPGYLKREFTRDGRRCFRYEMDRPILNFFAYLSGRWEVKRGKYKDIPIEVYYDKAHGFNVDRMVEATHDSLAYLEENFTPYQHRQARVIEFPSLQPG